MRDFVLNPPILIILIGIFFVYFLLLFRLARIQKIAIIFEKVTIVLFLLLLIKPTIPPLIYLQPDALAGRDKTFISAIVQLAVYGFFIVLSKPLFRDFSQSLFYLFKDSYLGTILILSFFSSLFSETPLVCLRFAIIQFFISLFAAQIARKNDWDRLEKYARSMCCVAAILSIFTVLAIPSKGIDISDIPPFDVRWIGIFPFPIKLGTGMALSITLWLNHYLSKKSLVSIGVIALSFFLLVKSASAQAFFTLIVLLGFLFVHNFMQKFNPKQSLLIGMLLIFVFIFGYIVLTTNLEAIFGAFGKDTTLTGRTEFWPQMLDSIAKRPILGYGVQGFWQSWRGEENPAAHIRAVRGFIPPNGHNGFLDLALEIGCIGLGLFLVSLILNLVRAFNFWGRSKSAESVFPLLIIAYVIMSNVSETQLFVANYIWFFYVIVAVRLNLGRAKQYSLSATL
ncbi:O-antigen ligase family protein [Floridanema evergladense]|uniref:O-antigen ligase family protein n=1 Tax=Floridaenema evergladense BLCC-F167 TaxID=3153639 RepID=A0ABV4WYP6_9CYAN